MSKNAKRIATIATTGALLALPATLPGIAFADTVPVPMNQGRVTTKYGVAEPMRNLIDDEENENHNLDDDEMTTKYGVAEPMHETKAENLVPTLVAVGAAAFAGAAVGIAVNEKRHRDKDGKTEEDVSAPQIGTDPPEPQSEDIGDESSREETESPE